MPYSDWDSSFACHKTYVGRKLGDGGGAGPIPSATQSLTLNCTVNDQAHMSEGALNQTLNQTCGLLQHSCTGRVY